MMKEESRNCQNCKRSFVVASEDFSFLEKIKVPPPTFCPWCRFIRRMAWRNERVLYKRICDLCNKNIISTYPADSAYTVYCWGCWHSDAWDPLAYGQDYDFSRPFFEQYGELMRKVPQYALWQRNVVNSEYANLVGESRNVYMSVSVVLDSENIFHSKNIDASSNIYDSLNLKNSESCYENIEGDRNYNSQYLLLSRNSIDSYYLLDCVNCSNCCMSSNLRNKQYYFRNKPYTKSEYFKALEALDLGSKIARAGLLKEFQELCDSSLYKFADIVLSPGSSGHNLASAKNVKDSFDCYDAEDFKYCYRAFISKDCMDYSFGLRSELVYEYTTGAKNLYNVRFSVADSSVQEAEYANFCMNAKNLFGCVGVKDKEYVIFNKVYPKAEFNALREKIIKQMNALPYVDNRGRMYAYGEFFPFDLSPYMYNETAAQEFAPLTKEEALSQGQRWLDTNAKNSSITMMPRNIPDNISDVKEKILDEIIGCRDRGECNHHCTVQFRVTQSEFQFYVKQNIPIPDQCPNCRYYERFSKIPKPVLYHRQCICAVTDHGHGNKCPNEFETPYAPDRPENVYCEACYNKEVY